MHPLSKNRSLAKYKFQIIKGLLAGLRRQGEPDHVVTFATPVEITTYSSTGTSTNFLPVMVIADLVAEIEALHDHIARTDSYRATHAYR